MSATVVTRDAVRIFNGFNDFGTAKQFLNLHCGGTTDDTPGTATGGSRGVVSRELSPTYPRLRAHQITPANTVETAEQSRKK